jgi:signal transduction histidine kinase
LSAIKPINNILKSKENNIFKEEVEVAKGFILQVSVISIPLGSGGKDIGHLIILHDVSREKIAENMKTEFVSLAAHQLRTPLSIIKWSMSMLRDGDFGKINKKQNRIIENTFKGNERLIYLVNDLLDITRIEEGRYLYNVASSDMKEVVRLAIDSYKEEIKNSKIKIDFECPPNMPQMTIDAEKIKLVVQNLIDNAIKYSPEGSRILITLKHDNENIQFKIQDFGMGIPKNQQDKIFTKFFRGDNATKVNTVGTGLGLFLAQNIIEAHGGKIWFESEDDPKGIPGAIFYFSLPIGKNSI